MVELLQAKMQLFSGVRVVERSLFDPLVFLAKATAHIPNRVDHRVRYYGYYLDEFTFRFNL